MTSNAFQSGGNSGSGSVNGRNASNLSSIGLSGGNYSDNGSRNNFTNSIPTLWNPGQMKMKRVTADSSTVRQGLGNITVTMAVVNTGDTPVNVNSVDLDFNHPTAGDVTGDYTVNRTDGISQLGPHESDTFVFEVDASRDASTGTVEIDGSVTATDAESGLDASIYRARSTDTWTVEPLTLVNINEVVPDPSAPNEWVELYNPNGSTVDVTGWSIVDEAGNQHDITSGSMDDGNTQVASDSVSVTALGSAFINNSGDTVYLEDDLGIRVDTFVTGTAVTGQTFSAYPDGSDTVEESTLFEQSRGEYNRGVDILDPGATFSDTVLVEFQLKSLGGSSINDNSSDSFTVSVDGNATLSTTPQTGTYNSGSGQTVTYQLQSGELAIVVSNSTDETVTLSMSDSEKIRLVLSDTETASFVPKVVINEFMPDPDTLDHDNDATTGDGDEEYVEIFNTTSDTVDVNNWEINETSGDNETVLNGQIPPSGFLTHWASDEQYIYNSDGDTTAHFTGVSPLGSINNSGETIQLRTPEEDVVDQKEYGGSNSDQAWARRLDGWDQGSVWTDMAPPHPGVTQENSTLNGPANGRIKFVRLPDTVTANTSFNATIQVADPNGDTVASFDTDVLLGSNPGSISPSTVTATDGVFGGSFSIALNDSVVVTLSGTYALTTQGTDALEVYYPTVDSGTVRVDDNYDTLFLVDLDGSGNLKYFRSHEIALQVRSADTVTLYHTNDGSLPTTSDTSISLSNTTGDTWTGTLPDANFSGGDTLNFIVEARDQYGNSIISDSSGQGYVYRIAGDVTPPPKPTLLTPDPGADTNTSSVSFDWSSVSDTPSGLNNYHLQVAQDTGFTTISFEGDTTASDTRLNLSDNVYYWRVYARDNAGNTSGYTQTDTFVVDLSAPDTADIITPTAGAIVSGDVMIEAIAEDALTRVDTVTFRVDGSPVGTDGDPDTWTTLWNTNTFADGNHNLSIRVTDSLGNSRIVGDTTVTVDNTAPPLPTLQIPPDGSDTNADPVPFNWTTVTDGQTGMEAYRIQASTDATFNLSSIVIERDVFEQEEAIIRSPSAWGVESDSWDSPQRADTTADGNNITTSYAREATDGDKEDYVKYGFSINPDSVVSSVEVGIEYFAESDDLIDVRVSPDSGETWSSWKTVTLKTSDNNQVEWIDFSGAANWNASSLNNSNLRVEVRYNYTGSGVQDWVDLDWIPVRVRFAGGVPPSETEDPGLPEAEYHWRVYARDDAGNTSGYTVADTFVADRTAPALDTPSLSVSDGNDTLPLSNLDGDSNLLDGRNHSISVTVPDADTVTVYHTNDGSVPTTSDTAISLTNTVGDTWTGQIPDANLSSGDTINIVIEAIDRATNTSLADSGGAGFRYEVISPNTLPTVSLEYPDTGVLVSGDAVPGTYVIMDPDNEPGTITVEVSDDSGATWDTEASISGEVASISADATGDTHTFTWDSLADLGTAYDTQVKLRIRATDGNGTGPWDTGPAFTVDNQQPVRVTSLASTAAVDGSDTGVYLYWTYASDDVEEFRLYRSYQTGDTSQASLLTTVGDKPDTITYHDAAVTQGDSYFYYVTAVDTAGNESDSSNRATAAAINFVKSSEGGSFRPGDTITYTIDYTNVGFGPATEIQIVDALPSSTVLADSAAVVNPPSASIEYSLDNGTTWQTSSYPRSDVEQIRWTIDTSVDPRSSGVTGTVRFTVKIQ
jgi:uncharacterized repeat protein (TIGR01451 family)